MTNPEIEELKSLVEQKYGKLLATTTTLKYLLCSLRKQLVRAYPHQL